MEVMDILRGLPFPMQGALMTAMGMGQKPNYYTPSEAVQQIPTNQGALAQPSKKSKASAGVALPVGADRIENPEDPMASPVAQQAAAFAGDNVDAGGGWNPALAPAMAADQPDNIDAGGGQNFAMAGPQKSEGGILNYLNNAFGVSDPDFIGRLGTALAVAGSQDPTKSLLAVQQGRREQALEKARIAELERERRKPISAGVPGVFLQPTANGGWETVVDPKALEAAKMVNGDKFNDKLLLLLAGKQFETQAAGAKQDIKDASETRPQLQQSQQMLDSWTKAKDVVTGQANNAPWMSKVQGALPGVSGFFGGDQVAANKFLQGLKVDETLLKTAQTKGAISNEEMALFASPTPSLSDDREKVWKPYIEQRIPVIEKLMQFQQSQIDRGNKAASGATVGGSRFTVPGLSEGASKYFSK